MRAAWTTKTLTLTAGLTLAAVALTAAAGPGDGSVVIIDKPDSPDLIIQELRAENADATHVPIKVRVTVPANPQQGAEAGAPLRWARLTAYLTATNDPDAERLAEESLQLGPEWSNRSVFISIPSPGEGTYFAHVEGELEFEDYTSAKLLSTSTERVNFGKSSDCRDVQTVPFSDTRPCPVLFNKGSTVVNTASSAVFGAQNEAILDAAVERIKMMCTGGTLHRVSVHGWASTLYSPKVPNEVLARERADAVVAVLRARIPDCAVQIHGDSEKGTRAVTTQFGVNKNDYDANQCAQIQITSHTCVK